MACKIVFDLNNGMKMPALGLGTWRAPDAEVESAVDTALELGYRHFDLAPVYENEKTIGLVFKRWLQEKKVTRDELFIVTKLPPYGNRGSSVEKYMKKSLNDLQLDYVDIYLVHAPFGLQEENETFKKKENGAFALDLSTNIIEVWKEMERMVGNGYTKSIGISNFNENQIERILENCTIKPVTNQVELHLYFQQKSLVQICEKHNIIVTAFSPLGSRGVAGFLKLFGITKDIPDLIENDTVKQIAVKNHKTPAQVLLRGIVQKGIVAIPKSTNRERLRQNIEIFDFQLTDGEMEILESLDQNLRILTFEIFTGIEKHPEFPF